MEWWRKFLEVDGEPSMRNLAILVTLFFASIVIMWLAFHVDKEGKSRLGFEMFLAYLCAGGGVYGVGKLSDDKTKRNLVNVDQAPTPVVVPDAENVAITAGNVSVSPKRARKRG